MPLKNGGFLLKAAEQHGSAATSASVDTNADTDILVSPGAQLVAVLERLKLRH